MDLPSGLMWPTQDPSTEHANSPFLHDSFKGLDFEVLRDQDRVSHAKSNSNLIKLLENLKK